MKVNIPVSDFIYLTDASGTPLTGHSGQFAVYAEFNGAPVAPGYGPVVAEVDAVNLPGLYRLTVTFQINGLWTLYVRHAGTGQAWTESYDIHQYDDVDIFNAYVEPPSPETIEQYLSTLHGSGAWEDSGSSDLSGIEAQVAAVLSMLEGKISTGIMLRQMVLSGGVIEVKQSKYQELTVNLGPGWPLTDKQVVFGAKRAYTDEEFLFENACSVTDALNGVAHVSLSSADTKEAGLHMYEVKVSEPDGTLPRIARTGRLRIEKSIWP